MAEAILTGKGPKGDTGAQGTSGNTMFAGGRLWYNSGVSYALMASNVKWALLMVDTNVVRFLWPGDAAYSFKAGLNITLSSDGSLSMSNSGHNPSTLKFGWIAYTGYS